MLKYMALFTELKILIDKVKESDNYSSQNSGQIRFSRSVAWSVGHSLSLIFQRGLSNKELLQEPQ